MAIDLGWGGGVFRVHSVGSCSLSSYFGLLLSTAFTVCLAMCTPFVKDFQGHLDRKACDPRDDPGKSVRWNTCFIF